MYVLSHDIFQKSFQEVGTMVMSEWVIMIGSFCIVFGALDIMMLGDKDTNWKNPLIKILGGAGVIGVGFFLKTIVGI